jgi:NADPH:quinone reductase-like Zn-dependent oxidoreductase
MRAAIYKKYGPPEVIHFADIPKPQPKPNEVLVKIIATTVNRTDTGFRKAEYFIIRFFAGFFKPKNQILGTEFSGIIESIGSDVKTFKIGDQVFGLNTYKFGTHAEYVCIKENGSIAIKPSNLSFEEAAAVCDGLMLAINYVRKIDFSTKPKILINGASGSIGSAAVQLCHYYGAQITAVCGTKNLELIKSLGADEVIDYMKTDFTQNGQLYDVVLDAVGKSSFFKCKKILKPKGVYYSTELGYLSQNVFLALVSPLSKGKKVGFPIPTDNQKDILEFKQIIEEGNYRAVIDNVYPFDQIVEATKYVETGQKTGNVVIRVTED